MTPDLMALDRTGHVTDARPGAFGIASALDDTVRIDQLIGAATGGDRTAAHWPALDGLRGIAVAGVVAYHLGWISGGFLGVDLFFALSGFLITTLLVREHRASGRVDLVGFWSRRFRRLLPAVMALVAGVLVWCTVFGEPAEQAGARGDARWAIPYLANWHFVAAARDYWASATDSSVFTHLWSLAIEEQFYLVWPLVAWWALRGAHGERRLARVTAVGLVASAAAMVVLYDPASPSRVYLGTDTRAAALLVGALVALNPVHRMLRSLAVWRPRLAEWTIAVSAIALAVMWIVGGDALGFLLSGGLVVHSTLAALVVGLLAATSGDGGRAATWLDRPWLAWLGQRSYGIYLWHWPVIVLAEPRWTALPAPGRDVAMIALSLALAEASYRLLEHPVRRRTGWAAGRRARWATIVVTAFAAATAVAAPSGRGHVAAFDVASVSVPTVTVAEPSVDPTTPAAPPASTAPASPAVDAADADVEVVTSPPEAGATEPAVEGGTGAAVLAGIGPADVAGTPSPPASLAPVPADRRAIDQAMWIGDSVAADLAPALTAAFAAAGVTWIDGAGDGLRLTPGGGVDPVDLYSRMFAEHTFDTVVLQLSYWDSPADIDQLRMSLTWFSDQVLARGATLVVLTPPPVRDDLADPGLARQIDVVNELVAKAPGSIQLIDTTSAWGPSMVIDIDGDGAPDRKPDGVHVCPQGAARFASWLTSDLAGRFDGISAQGADVWAAGAWSTSVRYDTPAGACVSVG